MAQGFLTRVNSAVQGLPPGYFALVMATGIISVGFSLVHVVWLSVVMMVIAAVGYALLLVMSLWRLIRYPRDMGRDFSDPTKGFLFYTFVAGTNVLAARIALSSDIALATVLLCVALLTWLVLGYAIPWAIIVGREARPVLDAVDGTWFIWAVASQSIAVVAATLEPVTPGGEHILSVVAVAAWAVGIILYAVIGMSVVIRLLVHGITPQRLGPSYWVAMGASAITVLAGSRIIEMTHTPMVDVTRHLAIGGSVMFWAFATWLIPVLVAVGWWRHVRHRIRLDYEPTLWSIIFPLGMYAVCSIYLGEADQLPLVSWVGGGFIWVAFAAWCLTITAMLVRFVRPRVPAETSVRSEG